MRASARSFAAEGAVARGSGATWPEAREARTRASHAKLRVRGTIEQGRFMGLGWGEGRPRPQPVDRALSRQPYFADLRPVDRRSRGIAGCVDGEGHVTRAFDFLHHDRVAARGDGEHEAL